MFYLYLSVFVGAATDIDDREAALQPTVPCIELTWCSGNGQCSELPDGSCGALDGDECELGLGIDDPFLGPDRLTLGPFRVRDGACFMLAETPGDCFEHRIPLGGSPCYDLGLCDFVDGTCIRIVEDSDKDCCGGSCEEPDENSPCRRSGGCHAVGWTCAALSDADCRASDGCRYYGECKARRRDCVAGSLLDCQRAESGKTNPYLIRGLCLADVESCLKEPTYFRYDLFQVVLGDGIYGNCTGYVF